MKSQLQTWPRCSAFVGSPVETPRRTTLRLVGGIRSPIDLSQPLHVSFSYWPTLLPQQGGDSPIPVTAMLFA